MALLRNNLCKILETAVKPSSSLRWNSSRNQPTHNWSSASLTIYQKKSLDYLKLNHKKTLEYLKIQASEAVTFYEEFTGLKELKEAQIRVLMATQMLKEAQERRREAKVPLNVVQKKLQDFQPELRNTPREDDRYIQLIKEEHALMKDIKYLQQQLQEAENEEREAFELLSTSLRTSHEAERVQAEKTKYFSIIASIIGTIIGVLGSSIINRQRMVELKTLVQEQNVSQNTTEIVETLASICLKLDNMEQKGQEAEKNFEKISNDLNSQLLVLKKMNEEVFDEINSPISELEPLEEQSSTNTYLLTLGAVLGLLLILYH